MCFYAQPTHCKPFLWSHTVSTEKLSFLGCLFPPWISTVTVNLYRRDTRITEPKCLQRKHKHSWAKVTHSVRDKGAGIFLRKCLIYLCFMSVSLSGKNCHSLFFNNFYFTQNFVEGEKMKIPPTPHQCCQNMWLGRETKYFISPTDKKKPTQHEPSEYPLRKVLLWRFCNTYTHCTSSTVHRFPSQSKSSVLWMSMREHSDRTKHKRRMKYSDTAMNCPNLRNIAEIWKHWHNSVILYLKLVMLK